MKEDEGQKGKRRSRPTGSGVHEPVSSTQLSEVFSVSNNDKVHEKLIELVGLLWLPPSLPEKEKNAKIVRAFELFESLAPRDGAEAMLAMQMVGTHAAAMECLRRAMIPEQMTPARDSCLRNAQKMMLLYARQLEALNRNRGKGQQKVTVEYVNVEAGGQAIVGSVDTGKASPAKRRKKVTPSAFEGSLNDLSESRQMQRSRKGGHDFDL